LSVPDETRWTWRGGRSFIRMQRSVMDTRLKALAAIEWLVKGRSLGIKNYPRGRWLEKTR